MDPNTQQPQPTQPQQPTESTPPSQPPMPPVQPEATPSVQPQTPPAQPPMEQMQQTMSQAASPMQQTMPEPPHEKSSSSSFSFGRVFLTLLILLVIAALVGGAYYLGSKNMMSPAATAPEVTRVPTIAATATPAASSSSSMQTMTAGGVNTFAKYMVSIPTGWTPTHATTTGDVVTVAKGNYQLSIAQGAFGGGGCSYPDKPAVPSSYNMIQTFTTFVAIKDQSNTMYRRGKLSTSPTPATDSYEVCAWNTPNNSYQEFTPFGRITYSTPLNGDAAILAQMDGVVASLKAAQ